MWVVCVLGSLYFSQSVRSQNAKSYFGQLVALPRGMPVSSVTNLPSFGCPCSASPSDALLKPCVVIIRFSDGACLIAAIAQSSPGFGKGKRSKSNAVEVPDPPASREWVCAKHALDAHQAENHRLGTASASSAASRTNDAMKTINHLACCADP